MKIKFWGKEYQKGLNLTANLYNTEGDLVHQGFVMTETVLGESAIYKTANIFDTISPISAGIYVVRIVEDNNLFIAHEEIIFNGVRDITLLELKFMSEKELKQLRDALGIDGDKSVARDGQLQKKSEYPYNSTIDTNNIHPNDDSNSIK